MAVVAKKKYVSRGDQEKMLQEFLDDLHRDKETVLGNKFTGEDDVATVTNSSISSDLE